MAKGRIQRIQDPIHGLMQFEGMETAVIDILRMPEIQRLRRIRQTGMAHLVYPGTEHSRLSHSLGVAHLAIRILRHLSHSSARDYLPSLLMPSEIVRREFAIAALCHDLGHGPLSHVFENDVIGKNFDFVKWCNALGVSDHMSLLKGSKWHELVTFALLNWEEGELHRLLEVYEADSSKRISMLLRGKYFIPYLPLLIDSDVDIDRADFVGRDAYMSGVAYGRYDINWLISTVNVGENRQGKLVPGFDKKKSLRVVEQFLIARRALYDIVYRHKTVRSAERMVSLFMMRLRDSGDARIGFVKGDLLSPLLKAIAGEALNPREILSIDDYTLWLLMSSIAANPQSDETARDLAERITKRNLLKAVPLKDETISKYFSRNDEGMRELYEVIKKYCPGESKYYIVRDNDKIETIGEQDEHRSYFINDLHEAEQINEHKRLRYLIDAGVEYDRLYTLDEAKDAVKNHILSKT